MKRYPPSALSALQGALPLGTPRSIFSKAMVWGQGATFQRVYPATL
jgi:hypothetical protein